MVSVNPRVEASAMSVRENMRVFLAAVMLLTACAGGPGGAGGAPDPDAEPLVVRGAYRLEVTLRGGRGSREIGGLLTFVDEQWANFVSYYERTRVPAPCMYEVRGARIVTTCGGVEITIHQVGDGELRAIVTGRVSEEYEETVCGRWELNSQRQRVCVRWDEVYRTRWVPARGETTLIREAGTGSPSTTALAEAGSAPASMPSWSWLVVASMSAADGWRIQGK
jgi:hypothetical protein